MKNQEATKLYEMQAEILQAIAHPIRLATVRFLAEKEQCVCDIARHVGAERSNISRHLAVMLNAGVVAQRRDGLKMMYSLRARCVLGFLECLNKMLLEQHQANDKILAAAR